MQRVARKLPDGWVYLSDLQATILAEVSKRSAVLPGLVDWKKGWTPSIFLDPDFYSLSGEDKRARADELANIPRIYRLLEAKQRRLQVLVTGIVASLIERCVVSPNVEVKVFASGNLHPCQIEALLYRVEPEPVPSRFRCAAEASDFLIYAQNHMFDRVFVDVDTWSIVTEPRVYYACCEQEADDIIDCWQHHKACAGGYVVVKSVCSNERDPKRAIDRILKNVVLPDLESLLGRKIPQANTPAFCQLVEDAHDLYLLEKKEGRLAGLTKDVLISGLNLTCQTASKVGNGSVNVLWKALLERLPLGEANVLRSPGRRPKPN